MHQPRLVHLRAPEASLLATRNFGAKMIGMLNIPYAFTGQILRNATANFPLHHTHKPRAGRRPQHSKQRDKRNIKERRKKMKRVVVCWDGSDGAKRALKAAQKMVDENIGELVLLHVSEVFEPRGPDGRPLKPASEGPHPPQLFPFAV
jgi:hypothetical protein